jgi:hypothetical protein
MAQFLSSSLNPAVEHTILMARKADKGALDYWASVFQKQNNRPVARLGNGVPLAYSSSKNSMR